MLGRVVVVVCGCVWLWFVVVLTLCEVVWGGSASWCVVFRAGTWWVPRVTSFFVLLCCGVCLCVLVLDCLFCGVRFCVLRWGLFGVGFCLVVSRGVSACLVAFRCGTLACGVLCCVSLLLLFLVGLVGLSFCGVVLWQLLWSFPLLSVVVGLIIGVLCRYVRCASLFCRVAPCYMLLCSILRSYGSCIVSWRVLCHGVLCCGVVLRCVGLYVGMRQQALSHGVVCCYLAVCCLV